MEKIKVVFLDIDGVLQSSGSRERFNVDRKVLVETLSKELKVDYSQYDEYDVAAVYHDWDKKAIATLKHILDETGAKIVVSSDWRNIRKPNKMRDLLRIHGLDLYYLGDTLDLSYSSEIFRMTNYSREAIRTKEIEEYLLRNKELIEDYVAIDDMDLVRGGYVGNFIHTHSLITKEQGEECIAMLNMKQLKHNGLVKRR